MKYVESGENYIHSVGYEYDEINNLTALVETINGVERQTSYTYDLDNRVTGITTGDSGRSYSYDALGRISQWVTKHGNDTVFSDEFTFAAPTGTAVGTTTGQIARHYIASSHTDGLDIAYTYTYDDNGNILSVSDGTNTTSYVYDTANQLLRENNEAANKTYVWTYDNAGNILSRSEYAYTTAENPTSPVDTVTYTYGDEAWGDLLTAYDGQVITYDTIGNPANDGTWNYVWEHGRQLSSMSATDGSVTWNYTYNADGMRTSRTDGTTTYSYVYNGSSLSQMTVDGNTLRFAYDANGLPMSVTYNGTDYYYALNLQGDVVAILNTTGSAVVQYSYDAWGNILTTTGSMATTLGTHNPLRYRGYVYDTETTLYYLQSRYYNPESGRYLNSDGYTSTGQGFLGNNAFVYCLNSPCNLADRTGTTASAANQWIQEYGWITHSDGPLPIADLIFVVGLLVGVTIDLTKEAFSKTKSADYADIKAYAASLSTDKEKYNVHHIVAKEAFLAEPAREVLSSVGIDPWCDALNLVIIPEKSHWSLHTKAYYEYVNDRLDGLHGNKRAIEWTLVRLRFEIIIYAETGWKAW